MENHIAEPEIYLQSIIIIFEFLIHSYFTVSNAALYMTTNRLILSVYCQISAPLRIAFLVQPQNFFPVDDLCLQKNTAQNILP